MTTKLACCLLLVVGVLAGSVAAEPPDELEARIDSLFVIASSGEVRYRDMNEPAMDSIAALGEAAVPFLVDKFTTKSARERWTIIWILQRIGSPAVPHLVGALDRPDGLVVQRICWALGDIGDSAAVDPLIGVTDHERWQVREQAIEALGKIGSKRADDAVMKGLADTIGQVRKAAVVAAGRLTILEAAPLLVHRLGDDFYGARLAAVDALLKLDTALVLEVLVDSVTSAAGLAGDLGCHVLGEIGTDTALEVLKNQALSGSDQKRRVHAAVALVRADPKDNCGYYSRILESHTDRLARLKIESARDTSRYGKTESAQ